MTASPGVRPSTAIADPDYPAHVLRPTANGEMPISSDLTLDPTNLALSAKQDTGNTSLAAISTAIGSVSDAAWSGSGNGTVIAILKAIAANTAP